MTEVWGSAPQRNRVQVRHVPGTPCWTSLLVHDLEATKDFYGGLFGWTYSDPGPCRLGPCVRATIDGRDVAGLGELPPDRRLPTEWTTYLASDDADVTAEWIRCSGGTVGVGPIAAEDVGRLVLASDPAGAPFGVRQAQDASGPRTPAVPGTPVWHELLTHDAAVAVKFYKALFPYELKPADSVDADRLTLHLDGRPVASVRGAGAALRRPHWTTWFEVADTDAAARRAEELGGRVLRGPHDEPAGRTASVADPEGAVLTLVRTPR
ncbi:VOC family protein [Streptomyces sp. I05A-00742]|uniref:VOC family protein n=1 Tax=Streptomyces sp. I05A-00742 TaxID=2732853 RepID=UPI00148844F5|nr:VOC family protein [Streptomyces sp. I05A-00742]